MTNKLQIAAWLAGAVLNALLAYEAAHNRQPWWKIVITAGTALGLLVAAAVQIGR